MQATQGGVTHLAGVEFMFMSSKVTVKHHSTEMSQQEQVMRGKEH